MKTVLAGVGLSAMMLSACASAPGAAVQLVGSHWDLVSADQGFLAAHAALSGVTLQFGAEHVSGYGGCNTYRGTYTLDAGKLAVGPIGATKRGCMDPANEVEAAWFATLSQPLAVSRDGDKLRLTSADGTQLRFRPGKAPAATP